MTKNTYAMKKGFLFLMLISCSCFMQAQKQNKECLLMATRIDSLVKVNDFDNAYKEWKSSGKCTSESMYVNGEKILLQLLAAPATAEKTQEYVSGLLGLYDGYDKKFPGNKNANLVKKATVMDQYKAGAPEDIFTLLDRAFTKDAAHFTDAKALYAYFELYFNKFKSGDKTITENDVFAKYDAVAAKMQQLSEAHPEFQRDYKTAKGGMYSMMSSITSCEKLKVYYSANFDANKTDVAWLQAAAENLASRNCTYGILFLNITTEWYKLRPDSNSAYNLAIATLRNRKNPADTLNYFNFAAEKEADAGRKAEIYLEIASMFSATDLPKAIEYAKKATVTKPSLGKSYLLLAQLYVASDCGETAFGKKAIYFLAAETAIKAGDAEVSMKKKADVAAAQYLKNAPSKDEIKSAKQAGKTIVFGCGINESVTVPK
jgi:hypothetical protein